MLMWMVCLTAKGCVDVSDLCHDGVCDLSPLKAIFMCMVCVAVSGHVGVCGLSTHRRPDVYGPHHHQSPCICPWSALLPEIMLVSLTHVAA